MIPDVEFVSLVTAAHRFRAEVGNLGFSGPEIDANVRARLYWNARIPELAAGHEALADDIYALLGDARLSATQQAQLEREYFHPRHR